MKKKILIVDDIADSIQLAANILTNEGYLIEYAVNGFEAREWIDNDDFDLVLLDVMMPDMDGFQVCKKVRENPKYNDLPIIFLSAITDKETTIKGLKAGAQDFATKPYNSNELLLRIKNQLDLSDARKQLHDINYLLEEKVKELTSSEIQYRRLFESAKDGILILDAETGKIVDVNPFLIELLGYSKEQFIEKEIWEIGFFKDILANKDKFLELQQKEYIRYENLPLESEAGRKINVEFVSNVYLVNNHKVIQCNIRDITIRKQTENELNKLYTDQKISKDIIQKSLFEKNILVRVLSESEANLKETIAIKDKFFSIIAHDIKGPFSGFLGLTDLMAKEADDLSQEDVKSMSVALNKSAKNVYNLIEDLLLWSSTQTGSIPLQPELLDLQEISTNILKSLHHAFKIKNIAIINNIETNTMITADINMIKTVLRNLVSNSIKFTNNGGKIEIGVINDKSSDDYQSSDDYIKIYVKDNGIGIQAKNLNKIFRVDEHYTTPGTNNENGTGLGIILCKEFVEKHGGKIWVESEEGKGTTFIFSIPNNINPSQIETSKVNLEKPSKLNKIKILIADDDLANYEFLYNALIKSDTTILRAENGQQAVELVNQDPDINLILMDIQMPLMDGFIATKQIKKIRPDLPVIAQTAYDFSQGQSYILSVGFNDYLTKPVDIDNLNILIEKYLG